MKLVLVILMIAMIGCTENKDHLRIFERDGLECASVQISTGGGLSCNWEKYNQQVINYEY